MAASANKQIIPRLYADLFNGGDPGALADLLDPAYVGHDPPDSPVPVRGLAAMAASAARMRAAFPDCRFVVEDLIAEGDAVAARVALTGTHAGPLGTLAPTGRRVAVTGTVTYRLRAGRIVASRGNWDNLGLLRQLGLLPPGL